MRESTSRRFSSFTLVAFVVLATTLTACGDDATTADQSTVVQEVALHRRPPPRSGTGGVAGGTGGVSGGASAVCPNNDGTCAGPENSRLVCVDTNGHYACVAAAGAGVCSNGQTCSAGFACGNQLHCNAEAGICSFYCFGGGSIVVSDRPVGATCELVDVHGVIHVCVTAFCSNASPSICLPSPPPPMSPINQG